MASYAGIDISTWQTDVDYKKLATATIGGKKIKYAFVRAGYGTTEDKLFKKHVDGLLEAGIHVGIYVYSLATTTAAAKAEADFVMGLIKKYGYDGKITYPIAYDLEEESIAKKGSKLCTSLCKTFCETIESYNYYPIIYTNLNWLFWAKNITYSELKKWPFWVAAYVRDSTMDPYLDKVSIWQHSVAGHPDYDIAGIRKVPGVVGQCDCNISYIGFASAIRKLGKNKFISKDTTYTVTATMNNVSKSTVTTKSNIPKAFGLDVTATPKTIYSISANKSGMSKAKAESAAAALKDAGFTVKATPDK